MRNWFVWIFPTVFVFLLLSLCIAVVAIRTYHSVMVRPQTSCFVFNNTRVVADPNRQRSDGIFVDYVVVGYNTSSNGTNVNLISNLTIFEHYATILECRGEDPNPTSYGDCGYYHSVSISVIIISSLISSNHPQL